MAIPKIEELYDPILSFLLEYDEESLDSIRKAMKEYFYMTSEEAFGRDDNKKAPTLFERRVNRSCSNLYNAGLLRRPKDGIYAISGMGRNIADTYEDVDNNLLRQIKKYQEHIISQGGESNCKSSAGQLNESDKASDQHKKMAAIAARNRPEFVLIEQPTIAQIVKLKRQDARFANMIASGHYMYEDGTIKEVPQEVMVHSMSYEEFKAANPKHGADESAILCYEDVNGSGKMVSAPPKNIAGYHKKQKTPVKWENPVPWLTSSGDKYYSDVKEMLDFIRRNPSFHKCFEHLIKDVYKISKIDISKMSGVNDRKIQRMMNNPSESYNAHELAAIFWVLRVHASIVEAMFDLAGLSPKSPRIQPYVVICTLTVQSTYEEVNALCQNEGLKEMFPKSFKGRVL